MSKSGLYNNISGWIKQLLEIMAMYVTLLVIDLVAYIKFIWLCLDLVNQKISQFDICTPITFHPSPVTIAV